MDQGLGNRNRSNLRGHGLLHLLLKAKHRPALHLQRPRDEWNRMGYVGVDMLGLFYER